MNAHEAMKIKLEILKAIGSSDEFVRRYCPEVPPRKPGEDVRGSWKGYLSNALDELLAVAGELEPGVDSYELEIFDWITSELDICPYCSAHSTGEGICDCNRCSYRAQYGECGTINDNWSKFSVWVAENRNDNYSPPLNLKQIIGELKERLL